MWHGLDHLSRILIDAGIANAILLSVIVALVVLSRQPARRIVLIRTGFCAALLMLPLVALGPAPRVRPIDWMFQVGLAPPIAPTPSSDLGGAAAQGHAELQPTSRSSTPSDPEWPAGGRFIRALTLIYLAGAAIGLAWIALGHWGFQRLLRRSTDPRAETRRVFDELLADLGRSPSRPDLRVSRQLQGPVLGGPLRPTIIIPETFEGPNVNREALRLALLHEQAHADRGDVWLGALAGLVQALWFFLPQPWWLRSQLRIDQEFLADRAAAGPPSQSTTYARWLVGLSGTRAENAPSVSELVVEPDRKAAETWREGAFRSPLLQRVAMLLHCPFVVEDRPPRWYEAAAPALLAGLAIFLSSLRFLAPIDASTLPSPSAARDPMARSFQIPQFTIVPGQHRSKGREDAYVLPLALPPTFHLQAEIHATPSALAQIRVARYPLATEAPPDKLDDEETPSWRAFSIHRDRQGATLTVDGHPVPIEADAHIAPEWLTITPAETQTATLRNLIVTW